MRLNPKFSVHAAEMLCTSLDGFNAGMGKCCAQGSFPGVPFSLHAAGSRGAGGGVPVPVPGSGAGCLQAGACFSKEKSWIHSISCFWWQGMQWHGWGHLCNIPVMESQITEVGKDPQDQRGQAVPDPQPRALSATSRACLDTSRHGDSIPSFSNT